MGGEPERLSGGRRAARGMGGGRRRIAMYGIVAALAAAAAGGAAAGGAHAAPDDGGGGGGGGPIPAWVKTVFGYYADGGISDDDLIGALQYLIDLGVIALPAGGTEQAAPAMSEEAAWVDTQAGIADCMAAEARHMIAAWELDMRASRGYASQEYEAEMGRVIVAGRESVQASQAWADAMRQAAADGEIAAAERAAILDAEAGVVDAEADLYDAMMGTAAGQLVDELGSYMPGGIEAFMQAATLSGAETECYGRQADRGR